MQNKTISDDKLRKAFSEMPLENLSSGFVENLMPKIEKAAANKQKENTCIMYLQIVAGVLSIFFFLMLTFYLCHLFIPGFSFSLPKLNIRFNQNIITIGTAVMLLLIIDSLRGLKIKKKIKHS
jgi:flagellar biosynthesis protein FlhB